MDNSAHVANVFHSIQKELIELSTGNSNYTACEIEKEALEGSLKLHDAILFRNILEKYKPKTILEVGSFLGLSTRWILETSSPWQGKVTAVDPNIRHRIFDQPRSTVLNLNDKFIPDRLEVVEAFFGQLIKCSYYYWLYETYEPKLDKKAIDQLLDSKQIVDDNWPCTYDLIFIDGEHEYEAVKSNFITAIKLLKKNGVIVFHDAYSHSGVARFIEEIRHEYGEKAEITIHGGILNKYGLFRRITQMIDVLYSDGLCEFRMV